MKYFYNKYISGKIANDIQKVDEKIGTLSQLTTEAKTNIVSAINSVKREIGNITQLTTTTKTNIVAAINSVKTELANAVTKSMMSNQQTNSTNKVPTSALVYTMQQEITKLNNEGKWSGWSSLGSAIGINFYYRYNAKLVEIRYDGTLEKGKGITGQSIGYTFGKIPPAYKPKYNIMHSIPSTSSKSLMVRLYPGAEQYSVTSQDTITTQTEYVCGCIVYGR